MAIAKIAAYEPSHVLCSAPPGDNLDGLQAVTLPGWYQVKLFLDHASGISMDALHILVGFSIFLLAAHLLRKSVASPLPWLALLALELANEAYDLQAEIWPDRAVQWGEGAKDIILTMALPTLVMLLARWRPLLLRRESEQADAQSSTR